MVLKCLVLAWHYPQSRLNERNRLGCVLLVAADVACSHQRRWADAATIYRAQTDSFSNLWTSADDDSNAITDNMYQTLQSSWTRSAAEPVTHNTWRKLKYFSYFLCFLTQSNLSSHKWDLLWVWIHPRWTLVICAANKLATLCDFKCDFYLLDFTSDHEVTDFFYLKFCLIRQSCLPSVLCRLWGLLPAGGGSVFSCFLTCSILIQHLEIIETQRSSDSYALAFTAQTACLPHFGQSHRPLVPQHPVRILMEFIVCRRQ